MGVNLAPPPAVRDAVGLRAGTSRLEILDALIPALRAAAARGGAFDHAERAALARRDVARGRRALAPGAGLVEGISAAGELLIRAADGAIASHRSGSLVFAEDS
jgi:hypothetical protein